jgi:hypothetical protein
VRISSQSACNKLLVEWRNLRELIFLTLISFSGILWSTFLFIQETWRLMSYMIFGIIALTNAMVLVLRIYR